VRTIVAVIGGETPPADVIPLAEEVGARLARAGAVVACGGLGGVMAAVCRGAHKEGGLTMGIIPGFHREEANQDVDIPIITGLGVARNVIVALTGQAVIAIDGSYGTLSEIAHTLETGKPVIALRSWPLPNSGVDPDRYRVVSSAEEAVRLALQFAAEPSTNHNPFQHRRKAG
jgi:uncharacterized protein (TIGR00725 family)